MPAQSRIIHQQQCATLGRHHLNWLVYGRAEDKAMHQRRSEAFALCGTLSPETAPIVFRLAIDGRFDSVIKNLK